MVSGQLTAFIWKVFIAAYLLVIVVFIIDFVTVDVALCMNSGSSSSQGQGLALPSGRGLSRANSLSSDSFYSTSGLFGAEPIQLGGTATSQDRGGFEQLQQFLNRELAGPQRATAPAAQSLASNDILPVNARPEQGSMVNPNVVHFAGGQVPQASVAQERLLPPSAIPFSGQQVPQVNPAGLERLGLLQNPVGSTEVNDNGYLFLSQLKQDILQVNGRVSILEQQITYMQGKTKQANAFLSLDEDSPKRLIELAKSQPNMLMSIFDIFAKVASICGPLLLIFKK